MSRLNAFVIHLFISALVFGVFLGLTYFVWYPAPYFDAIGTQGILKILTSVDVVLGPLLTLIVFKSGKKGLKLDLFCIAGMQLMALIYGLFVVLSVRPAFVVFSVDRFEVMLADETLFQPLASPEFMEAGFFGPRFASLELPTGQEGLQVSMDAMNGGRDVGQRQEYYRNFTLAKDSIFRKAEPLSVLLGRDTETDAAIARFIEEYGRTAHEWKYLPMVARNRDMAAVIDEATGTPIAVVHVYPWRKNDMTKPTDESNPAQSP